MSTTADLAWAAGFTDGEATFTLIKSYDANRHIREYDLYYTCIQIALAEKPQNLEALRILQELFGGTIQHRVARKSRQFPQYFWRISNSKASKACELLEPFLVIKREHAQLLVKFQGMLGFKPGPKKRMPESIIRERLVMVDRIRALNLRGDKHPLFAPAETKRSGPR